jgi:hypothetical protein
MPWKIKNKTAQRKGKPLYWSEDVGWTWKEMSDTFTEDEKQSVNLPMNSEWEEQQE